MLKIIKSTLKDLFGFLKNPKEEQDIDQSTQKKAKRFFSILAIDLSIMILLSLLINGFAKLGWIEIENHKVKLLIELMPIWLVFLLTVIVIPFVEEIIFRLFLKFKRNYFLQIIISLFPQSKTSISRFWTKKFGYVFYISAIAFALIHISNYDSNGKIIYLIPFLVLPQFIMGLFLGYLRVRYNFMLGYFMHALHNAIFITVGLFSMENTSNQKLNLETNEYSLKIEEVSRVKTSYINNFNQDSISFIGTDFKSVISTLANKDFDLIDSNNEKLLNKKITLDFTNNSTKNINKDSLILKHLSKLYAFEIETKQRNQKVYNLFVKDTLQLLKYSSKNESKISNTSTTASSNSIKFENTTLDQIAKTLSVSYQKRFEADDKFAQEFNINLPNGNFEKLESTLKKVYGIYLKEKEKEVEYIYINFQE